MQVSTEGGGAELRLKRLSLGHYGKLFVSGQHYKHVFEDFKRRNITGFSSGTNRKCHPELTFSLAENINNITSTFRTAKRQVRGGATTRKTAFTLAEVLITLGIIGVVAAMTMPTLLAKYQEKVTVTRLKKVYSILSQAYLRAQEEYGTVDNWGFTEDSDYTTDPDTGENTFNEAVTTNSELFYSILTKYMNVASKCYPTKETCKITNVYRLNGSQHTGGENSTASYTPIIKLSDGTVLTGGWIDFSNAACRNGKKGYCGNFNVDINGTETPPNTLGRDVFYFKITKAGIYPHGGPDDDATHSFPANCNLTSTASSNGYGCTAWVIHNENMDYLHCDDLSWDGKKKCK